jgi:hypothetical protein
MMYRVAMAGVSIETLPGPIDITGYRCALNICHGVKRQTP